MLFIFIIFAMVVGGMLLVVGNMTAQPMGNGTYNTYTGYIGNTSVAQSMGAVIAVSTVETNAGQGILIMIAAIVIICAIMMVVVAFKTKRGFK